MLSSPSPSASLQLPVWDLKIRRRRRQRKRRLKSEFAFIQSSSQQFQLTYFVKFRRTLLGVEFLKSISKSKRERKFRSSLFTSSIKREIRHFHAVFVLWRQRNVQKSVMHVQSCCFANLNLLFFWRSLCRRCRRILRSLLIERKVTDGTLRRPKQFTFST